MTWVSDTVRVFQSIQFSVSFLLPPRSGTAHAVSKHKSSIVDLPGHCRDAPVDIETSLSILEGGCFVQIEVERGKKNN